MQSPGLGSRGNQGKFYHAASQPRHSGVGVGSLVTATKTLDFVDET